MPNVSDTYKTLEEVIQKLQDLKTYASAIDSTNVKFKRLIDSHFFSAFFNLDFLDDIIQRLDDNKEDKEALAEYLTKSFDTEQPSCFIESGSTLAYFARSLAQLSEDKRVHETPLRPSILTNNFFVQTLLFEKFSEVKITSGALRKDYLAYLPFTSSKSNPYSEELTASDRMAFYRLDNLISSVETIYMTASTFGLLIGPFTRSRDNAIFKYCLFNNKAKRPIKFCISEQKIFRGDPHSSTGPRYCWNPSDKENTTSIFTHLNNCCSIFDIHLLCDSEADACVQRNSLQRNIPDCPNVIDGTIFKENCVCRNIIKSCDKRHSKTIFRSVPIELKLKHNKIFMEKSPIVGCYDTWLNYLAGQPRDNIEIIIGCKNSGIVKDLRKTVDQANKIIHLLGYTFSYEVKPPLDNKILHLIIR